MSNLIMADSGENKDLPTLDQLKTYKVPELKKFVARYADLKTTLKKDELLATAQAAIILNLPLKQSSKDKIQQNSKDYDYLLKDERHSNTLPDPKGLEDWTGEKDGICQWPSVYLSDITVFLMKEQPGENSLEQRLLNEYKQGKAYRYFTSEWLKEVFVKNTTVNGTNYKYLKARCTPSMKGGPKHEAWVITAATGEIVSAYCSCTAGLIETCNHVAGLLFRVEDAVRNGYTNPACTSLPCSWNIPSDKTKLQPKPVSEMKWSHEKYGHKPKRSLISKKRQLFQPLAKAQNVSPNTKFHALSAALKDTVPNAVMHQAVEELPIRETSSLESSVPSQSVSVPQSLDFASMSNMSKSYSDNEKSFPILSESEIETVEIATRGQSDSSNWHKIRWGRITASNFHSVYTCKSETPSALIKKFVKELPSDPVQNEENIPPSAFKSALKHGKNMEKIALKKYVDVLKASHQNVIVSECGIFLDRENSFLGASPDALVSCKCCGMGLVEIKCPYSRAHEDPNTNPPSYIVKSADGNLLLKKSHMYYTQVQGQLAITGRSWCDFFVYTEHGFIKERILASTDFWSKVKMKLVSFFNVHIIPKLLS